MSKRGSQSTWTPTRSFTSSFIDNNFGFHLQVEPDNLRKRQWDDESDDVTTPPENDVTKKRIKEESSVKTEPTDDSAKEVHDLKSRK